MRTHREEIRLKTRGECDVVDVTSHVRRIVSESGIAEGLVHLFVPGSTAGVTTIEYESGCLEDLRTAFERVAPRGAVYAHNERWGDGNGFSHVRAALLGPALSVPVEKRAPATGTWQQLVVVDFDNRPRERRLLVTVQGT